MSTATPQRPPALFSLIGNTPLLEVTRIDTGLCRLFLKLECQNPGGSIKDRIGRAMIEAAEADGCLTRHPDRRRPHADAAGGRRRRRPVFGARAARMTLQC